MLLFFGLDKVKLLRDLCECLRDDFAPDDVIVPEADRDATSAAGTDGGSKCGSEGGGGQGSGQHQGKSRLQSRPFSIATVRMQAPQSYTTWWRDSGTWHRWGGACVCAALGVFAVLAGRLAAKASSALLASGIARV